MDRLTLFRTLRRFRTSSGGNVALLFGLSAMMIFTAMGAGLDLSRAYLARQKLSQTATLACQYASRPSIVDTSTASYNGSNGGSTYVTNVNSFITRTWQGQNDSLTLSTAAFSYTQGGTSSVNLASSVPTTFMSIAGVNTIPIAVQTQCYPPLSACPQSQCGPTSGPYLLQESFEASGQAGGYKFYQPNGSTGTQSSPTSYSTATGYTGSNGTQWHITGYCLEQDAAGVIKSTAADGNYSVELDCDNGNGTKGNSAITTLVYVPAGTYELRYNYSSRVTFYDYDPTYICGSTASDLSWANSTNSFAGWYGARTNQINAYFDLNVGGNVNNAPPTHTTIDGTQQLSGSNLIDMCVYGSNWIERSVMMNVTTPGYYWLSFAADGANDSYGGQLDNIRLCSMKCPGSVQDNFPAAWLSSNLLFNDSFESPTYTQDSPPHYIAKGGNPTQSLGTSGTVGSGWPSQTPLGWTAGPYNQVNYSLNGAAQGNQHILLDGFNNNNPVVATNNTSASGSKNRLISRPFLLVPGYYQVSYKYISIVDFSSVGVTGTYCYAAPNSGYIFPSSYTSLNGIIRYYTSTTSDGSTNIVGAFMSNGQMVSTPVPGGAWESVTSYNNPDGTVTTTPKVPPDAVNWSNYDATAVNPVIDVCGYASNYAWQARSATVKITKPNYYWLTFSANGSLADGNGGGVDDVKLTALGSLYMSSPPTAVTIPVPNPQPGSTISLPVSSTAFTLTADALTP